MPALWIQPSIVDGLNSCIVNSASRFSVHSGRTLVGIRAQDFKALQKMNTSSTLFRHGSRIMLTDFLAKQAPKAQASRGVREHTPP